MIIRTLRWIAFALMLALVAHGLRQSHLLERMSWSPTGLMRLSWWLKFSAIYLAVLVLLRPGWLITVTAGSCILYTAFAVGPLPLLAAGLFLVSALAAGRWMMRTEGDAGPLDQLLALLAGIAAYIFIIGILVRFPVNYPLVYGVLLAAPVAWRWRDLWGMRRLPAGKRTSRLQQLSCGLFLFVLCSQWLVVLKPEVSADGLAMHLALPARIAFDHRWNFDVTHTTWAVMPMGADWCFTGVYLLGGEYAARLLNFAMLAVNLSLLYWTVRRWLSPAVAYLMLALFASLPLVQLVTGSLFVENIWASLLMGSALALLRYAESGAVCHFLLACGLLGTSLATKFGSMAFLGAVLGFVLWICFRQLKSPRLAICGFGLLLVCAAQPYATAYAESGNPLFPFVNAVFKSPYYETKVSFVDRRFTTQPSWHTLYDLTFATHRFLEGEDGAAGLTHFLFLPLFLLTIRKKDATAATAAFAIALIFCFCIFRTTSNLRYLYPGLLLWMVPIGWMFSVMQREQPVLFRTLLVAALVAIGINVYLLPVSGYYHRDFYLPVLSDRRSVDAYLEESAPVRKLVSYLNEKAQGEPAVFFDTNQIAGLHGKAFSNSWHNRMFQAELFRSETVVDELRCVSSRGIRYFVAPIPQKAGTSLFPSMTQAFLARFTDPEFQSGGFYVARLRDQFAGLEGLEFASELMRAAPPATAGVYDDVHLAMRYTGSWLHDGQFKETMQHSISYSNTPGDEVRFIFRGTDLNYFYTKAPNRGLCEVILDGQRRGVVDLYSSKIEWQSNTEFRGLGAGVHVLILRVSGKKSSASSDWFVDVDAFSVRD